MGGYNKIIIYGLKNRNEAINKIIMDCNLCKYDFDMKLILTEGLTNAYKHGNKEDESKPIEIEYGLIDNLFEVAIKDCGKNHEYIKIPHEINEDNILDFSGRGLFIINSLSDDVKFDNNTLKIKKNINL